VKVPFRVDRSSQPERLRLVRKDTAFIRHIVLGLGKLLLSERARIGYFVEGQDWLLRRGPGLATLVANPGPVVVSRVIN
jgi:hypothetical protein